MDFIVQRTGEVVQEALAQWHTKAGGHCAIDYGFHMILGGVDEDALKAMDQLVDHEGITSPSRCSWRTRGCSTPTTGSILRAMQKASNNGALIMMHAENGIAIDVLAAQAVARGDTDPIWHGRTRPSALEGEATNRAIVLAGVAGAPVYFVHMSASEALAAVAAARDAGRNVFAETCPQYLYLTLEDQLGAPGFEGAKWVASPPLRSRHEHHLPDLWKGPAHRRPRRGVHRPLPLLHEGPEGAGHR